MQTSKCDGSEYLLEKQQLVKTSPAPSLSVSLYLFASWGMHFRKSWYYSTVKKLLRRATIRTFREDHLGLWGFPSRDIREGWLFPFGCRFKFYFSNSIFPGVGKLENRLQSPAVPSWGILRGRVNVWWTIPRWTIRVVGCSLFISAWLVWIYSFKLKIFFEKSDFKNNQTLL